MESTSPAAHGGPHAVSAPTELPVKRKSRLPLFMLLFVTGTVVLGIGGYALATANQETTDDAQIEAEVLPLAARVGGQVVKVLVKENQAVKKGELLFELDPSDFAAKVKQVEAEVETAKAAVSGSSVAVSSADAQIAAAKAGLERAKVEAHKADLDLARAKELKAANAIPQEKLDNALIAHEAAEAALAQAKATLAAAEEQRHAAESRVSEAQGRLESVPVEAQIASAKAAAELARARVKSAEAALELAKLQLGWTKVVSPQDGVISRLGVTEGQLLQPGQPIGQLVPAETYVVANFKETQVGRMRPGQKARVRIDAYGARDLEGTVESLSGGTGARFSLMPPDNASGNFVKVVQRVPVRVAWKGAPPKELSLRAGLSAEVTVFFDEAK